MASPKSKFLKVKGSTIAMPTGGKAKILGEILEELE